MGDGARFEIDIDTRAGSVEPAAAALARLATRLTEAGAASKAAADAVAVGEAAFRQAESSADRAAKALEKIGLAADAQRGKLQEALDTGNAAGIDRAAAKLTNLVIRQGEAAAKAAQAASAVRDEAAALDRLKGAASAASEAEKKITQTHDAAKKAADATKKARDGAAGSGKVNEMAEAFGKLGGPLGQVGAKAFGAADGMKKLLGSLGTGAGAYAAIALAVVAVSAALVGGIAAMAAWSIGLSDAARSAALLSDGIAGTVEGGRALDKTIKDLGKRVPQTSDELRSMAAGLAKTGLKGEALSAALEDAAVKAAELKWGPDFEKETLSLGRQMARLKAGIGGIFGGLKLEKLLGGLSKLVDLFDETSVTGRAIKVVFESMFQPLVDGLASLAPKVVTAFIQFEIWVMKAMIAIKPFGSTIVMIAKVVGVALLVVVGVFATLAAVIVGMAALGATLVLGLGYLGVKLTELAVQGMAFAASMISGPSAALDWLRAKFDEVVAFLSGLSLSDIGKAMIDGLVQGITGAAGGILTAMTGAVGGAIDGAKGLLGIASPSKVFAEIGTNTGEGMIQGVDSSAASVQGSLEAMVSPPSGDAAVAASAPASSLSSGGGNFAGATFQFYGVEGAEDAVDRFLKLIEGDAAQLGTAVPSA